MQYQDIITIELGKRGGKPCIRGMRITVYDVLEYLASGMTYEEILEDFPYHASYHLALASGAGAPRSIPSVLKSSSRSSQWMP
ncbi:DUF433 domain-containing protein [Nodosilinea sp. E11]|uniref:DUF433 domain-containing protein n=1 Tax=Nodosilinea sp. E11 TaxID=3037479 RepID=UPI003977532B